jgi:hypothetical protein
MNLNSLVVETERKVRFLNRTQHLMNDERAQRVRTAEVQSALFVKRLLARCREEARARQKEMA